MCPIYSTKAYYYGKSDSDMIHSYGQKKLPRKQKCIQRRKFTKEMLDQPIRTEEKEEKNYEDKTTTTIDKNNKFCD